MTPDQAKAAGAGIILGNTYHLMIAPGGEGVAKLGGLHGMTGWDGPMLTDSGGFQLFSMGHGTVADEIKGRRNQNKGEMLLKIEEEGAKFKSYLDGSTLTLTPEKSMQIQKQLGADLIMPLDECTAYHHTREYTEKSTLRSHRWEDRSLTEFKRTADGKQALYGIIQGSIYKDLRELSTDFVNERDFFGIAMGGCFGGSKAEMVDIFGWCMGRVRKERPVHALGVGGIDDIFALVKMGVDTFDCVTPTRLARHGWAVLKGAPRMRMNLRNSQYRDDPTPLDPESDFFISQKYSRGYLHHLLKAHEPLYLHILSQHNIAMMTRLMREIRAAIATDTLDALEKDWLGE